jgi:hypothetical protein
MHCPASSSPRARAAPHARRTSLLMAWTWSVPVWHRGWRWVTVGVFPKCWPAARGVRGCALGLVNVALANLPAVCVIRIMMPCRPRSAGQPPEVCGVARWGWSTLRLPICLLCVSSASLARCRAGRAAGVWEGVGCQMQRGRRQSGGPGKGSGEDDFHDQAAPHGPPEGNAPPLGTNPS